jgi:hypothetical protein
MHSAQLLEKKVNVVIVEHARQRQFLDETVVCHRDTPRRNLPEKNVAAQIFVFPRLATSGLSGWPADRRKRRDGDRTPQVSSVGSRSRTATELRAATPNRAIAGRWQFPDQESGGAPSQAG